VHAFQSTPECDRGKLSAAVVVEANATQAITGYVVSVVLLGSSTIGRVIGELSAAVVVQAHSSRMLRGYLCRHLLRLVQRTPKRTPARPPARPHAPIHSPPRPLSLTTGAFNPHGARVE
jgi:hypothetical protein